MGNLLKRFVGEGWGMGERGSFDGGSQPVALPPGREEGENGGVVRDGASKEGWDQGEGMEYEGIF